jgi:hypothetical protein
MIRSSMRCLLGAAALLAGAGAASAADEVVQEQPPVSDDWTFTTAAYLWAAGIDGTVGQFGLPPVEVDASFSDILDHLDFGAMFVSELRKDQYGLFTDFIYIKLSGSRGTPLGIVADSVSVDVQSLTFTGAGEYRIVDQPDASLDLMAGARVWSVDTDVSVGGATVSDGDTWVDALAGVKGRVNLTPEIYLSGWAMAGGGSSDFMWDLWGGVGYEFNDRFSAVLGYRGLGVDYSNDDGFLYDVVQHGPIIGAVFRF